MAISSKPRPGQVHKKLKAGHHRQTKNYLKTYWPYLPILGIIALGLIINHFWHVSNLSSPQATLSSYSNYSILETFICLAALVLFLLRHAFAWHKVLIKGEVFATKHPMLDVLLVATATIGLLLAHHGIVLI